MFNNYVIFFSCSLEINKDLDIFRFVMLFMGRRFAAQKYAKWLLGTTKCFTGKKNDLKTAKIMEGIKNTAKIKYKLDSVAKCDIQMI